MRIMKRCKLLFLLFVCLSPAVYGYETGEILTGVASWYAGEFQGRLTANGETFDTMEISAAHKELPFGTIVRVTNLVNGMNVEVRINDRGPYVDGRIIDLSKAAAAQIDMVDMGIAEVTVEILSIPDTPESAYNRAEDADLVRIQIGAYSNIRTAYERYEMLQGLGLRPYAEVTDTGLIRVMARWIAGDEKAAAQQLLEDAGLTDLLVRPDTTGD